MKESHARLSRDSVTFRAAMAGRLAPALVLEMRGRVEASHKAALDRLTAITAAAGTGAARAGTIAESLQALAAKYESLDAWRDVLAPYDQAGRLPAPPPDKTPA